MGEAGFEDFKRLKNRLVTEAESFKRDQKVSLAFIPIRSKVKDEQLKLAQKLVDVVDRADRKTCVTLLRYSLDQPESSYAQLDLFTRKRKDEMFHQIVYVTSKLEVFIST